MKRSWLITAAALLVGTAACAYAQSQQPPQQDSRQMFYGRGMGGVPYAWNDADRDGVCDITGQPIGQRPIGFGRGWGRGWRGMAARYPVPPASQETDPTPQAGGFYGRGRGGLPYAWNDADRDGICDVTGQPVGQRPIGVRQGGSVGRGYGVRGGRGGRGARSARGARGWRWR
ncbi:MAG: hypothetical protein R6W82_10250 [bacterium]